MYDAFVTCQSCGAYIETAEMSASHARVMDAPECTICVAWCLACRKISFFERTGWARLFGRWMQYNGYVPVRAMSLGDLAAHHFRTPKGFPTYRHLMQNIFRCLTERAVSDGATDIDAATWRLAKASLPAEHLPMFCLAASGCLPASRLLLWLDEIETLPLIASESGLLQVIRDMRANILEQGH